MDREVLYRGKRVDNGEWAYGFYANCSGPGCQPNETRHYIVEYPNVWHEFYTATRGEYTGLKDRSGKRIFEGDIMEFDAWGFHYRGVVSFVDGNSSVICKRPVSDTDASPFLDDAIKRYDAVCAGNIHDNPELMEVQP